MKIVHVVYSLEVGGAEVLVAQLCRIQRRNGHQVSVCAYSKLGTIGEALTEEGFDIYVPGEAHPAITMLRYYRHFRKIRPDVVHCHNPAPTLQAALSARLAGARSVISTRHSLVAPPYDKASELKYNVLARACDHIVGICEVTCKNLRNTPLAQRSKIVRVYNGVPALQREASTELISSGFTLLFVGRLARIKDLGTLLQAVALARASVPGLQLWIVGDGPMRESLEALAKDLGITKEVQFWGQRMDTAQFFSSADVFVMSSLSEGLPMSLLQAMSIGVPALLTEVGGMAEVLTSSRSGLLTPVGDWKAMANAIVTMAQNGEMRAEFRERAIAAYAAEFTLKRMDAGYMELYRSVRGNRLPLSQDEPDSLHQRS